MDIFGGNNQLKRSLNEIMNFKIPKRICTEENNGNSVQDEFVMQSPIVSDPNYETVPRQLVPQIVHTPRPPKVTPPINHEARYTNVHDSTLPAELLMLFQPLYCKLCLVQLSSTVSAKVHYISQNHEKKVRTFLTAYSARTGEPLHPRAVPKPKTVKPQDNDPSYFHCQVCDLPLTGRIHAESHYLGKNHQKALCGKAPAGRGRYDEDGKWVRELPPVPLPEGRDSFGVDFLPKGTAPVREVRASELHCNICGVSATCNEQLAMHVNGRKHKKKLAQAGLLGATEENVAGSRNDNIATKNVDLSIHRTPSGHFYCKLCDITLNGEVPFKQHLNSKKHHKRMGVST